MKTTLRNRKTEKAVKLTAVTVVRKEPKPPKPLDATKVIEITEDNWDGTPDAYANLEALVLPALGYVEQLCSCGDSTCNSEWIAPTSDSGSPFEGISSKELQAIGERLQKVEEGLPSVDGNRWLTLRWCSWEETYKPVYRGSRYKTLEEVAKETAAYDKAYAAYEKKLVAFNSPVSKEAIAAAKEREAKKQELAVKLKEIATLRKELAKKKRD